MHEPQSHTAAFALTMLALLIGPDTRGQTALTQPQAIQTAPSPPWLALVSALAWPVAAIIMVAAFRRPLGDFLRGLATRITKLFVFKVELELAAAPSTAESPLLDDIRNATTPAAISDSSRLMLDQAQSTDPADYAEINLGYGEAWITSRLFIAAVMLERMRGAKVFVFLENTTAMRRRFVAVAPLAQVRWSLAQQFPWLETAWARAYLSVFPFVPGTAAIPEGAAWLPDPRTVSMTPSPIESTSGALSPWQARQVVSQFITLLQQPATLAPTTAAPSSPGPAAVAPAPTQAQVQPSVMLRSETRERASPITRELLETLLPLEAFDLWADVGRDAPRMRRTRSVLRATSTVRSTGSR